jgi:hypothetical protein
MHHLYCKIVVQVDLKYKSGMLYKKHSDDEGPALHMILHSTGRRGMQRPESGRSAAW